MVQRSQRENGQTLVEYALILSLFLLLVLGIMELSRVVSAYSTVANAAREGARYGVVRPEDPTGIRDAALVHTTGLDATKLQLSSSQNGITVSVAITYEVQLVSGIVVDALGGDPTLDLRAKSTMRVE